VIRTISIALLVFILAPFSLRAQTAQLGGCVLDRSGAAVGAVEVTITNAATGAARKVPSNEDGLYVIPPLQPGTYSLTATRDGFKSTTRTGMTVAVDQWTELDLILEIGSIAERVEVAAQSLQLNTVEASPGQVIENQRIVEMPLNGRYCGDLALLSAGTVPSVGGSRFNTFSSGGKRVLKTTTFWTGSITTP